MNYIVVQPKGDFAYHSWRFLAIEFIMDNVKYYRCYNKDTMMLVDKSATLVQD